jgi:hypothetical protein
LTVVAKLLETTGLHRVADRLNVDEMSEIESALAGPDATLSQLSLELPWPFLLRRVPSCISRIGDVELIWRVGRTNESAQIWIERLIS